MASSEKPRGFPCPYCQCEFIQSDRLQSHVSVCTLKTPHVFEHCGSMYTQSPTLNKHVESDHKDNIKEGPDRCFQSAEKSGISADLPNAPKHDVTKDQKLYEVKREFPENADLSNTSFTQLGGQIHSCEVCRAVFGLEELLQKHMLSHNEQTQSQPAMGQELSTQFDQSNYTSTFSGKEVNPIGMMGSEVSLQKDMVSKVEEILGRTNKTRYECLHCGKGYYRLSYLRRHLARYHDDHTDTVSDVMSEAVSNIYRELQQANEAKNDSPVSDTFYDKQQAVEEQHIDSHANQQELPNHFTTNKQPSMQEILHICRLCQLRFENEKLLQSHISAHVEELNRVERRPLYVCPRCGDTFVKSGFRNHLRLGKRSLVCPVCGKHFCLKLFLRKHIQAHEEYPTGPPVRKPKILKQ